MNQSKEEHHAGFVGPGSVKSMRTLYKGNEWPEDMGKSVSYAEGPGYTGYTAHMQLWQCG